jgi:PAS domain S-box-containing protein
MAEDRPEDLEDRVLVLAPTARDGAATRDLLAGAGVRCVPCSTIAEVCREADRGAGAALVTAEAVGGGAGGQLAGLLAAQPRWSDLPVIVLTPPGPDSPRQLKALDAVGRVTLMKRPVQVASLVSAVRAAVRDRRRQYEVRDLLAERERAAETLRAERERYRVTLSSIGDAVIATDAAGGVTFLNPVAASLTGWPPAVASGRPLNEVFRIVNEATRREVENPALRALADGAVVGLANHTVLISKDGAERPIDDSAAPIRAEDGTVAGAVLVFRDVTERRKGEEVRARLAAIVESSDDVIIGKTLDGVIQYWNAAAERVFGYTSEEAVGRPITLIIPPDRLDEERDILDRLRLGERIDHFETVRAAKGGRPVDVSVTVSPIRDAAGQVIGASKVARDITGRKRAAEELARVTAESERRKRLYETILSATPDFVYVFSLDHRVLYANDALVEMWGRGREGAIGKTFLEIGYEPWHADLHDREIDQVRETKRPIRGEVPFTGTFGRRIYDYIFVPVVGADGEVEAVAGTTRDVTDRKGMEDALREADRKKDEFIALLAHELRNPLAPLRNGLQVIRRSRDPATLERSQAMMDRQLAHMVRLVDDLLDVSRIGRNKMELRRERVTLADVLASAVETARPAVDEAGHELTLAVPPDPVHLDADLTRLAQVFSNLLTNSAKYTPWGGRIWLTAARTPGGVSVSVRDTGIGIPAESLRSVFDMFSQVDRTFERSSGGLGIGLALVKGLVEMHGGTVTAASAGPGRGSTFTVTLPTAGGNPAPAPATPEPADAAARPARRVLVVDDNRDGAESMADMLRLLGDEVRTAHDGVEAVAAAGAFRPGVILMDVGMPRLNGLDATRHIREQPWGKGIVIIALTGWGQETDRTQSREAGCDGHLVKPVSLTDLEKVLKESSPR